MSDAQKAEQYEEKARAIRRERAERAPAKGYTYRDDKSDRAGVREYWIAEAGAVYKYVLSGGEFLKAVHDLDEDSMVSVDALPGCSIDFRKIAALPAART